MAATKKAKSKKAPAKPKKESRCWEGYEPTPNTRFEVRPILLVEGFAAGDASKRKSPTKDPKGGLTGFE